MPTAQARDAVPKIDGLNLHIYQSTFENESRILKETRTLVDHGVVGECVVASLWRKGLPEIESIDAKRQVHRLRTLADRLPQSTPTKAIRFAEWLVRIMLRWARARVGMVNCHSLLTLPVGVLFKLFKGSRLVYDTHELETEAWGMRGIRKPLGKALERALIRWADDVIVVSESIATWYREAYSIPPARVHVVRNIPYREALHPAGDTDLLRRATGVGPDDLLFLYQGVLNPGRGIEMLLEAFAAAGASALAEPTKHIVLMGYGALAGLVKDHAERSPNIHFQPAVPPEEVGAYTVGADVGLAIIEPVCLSYEYCLPNKLYEYVLCGLPVIASDLTEMRRFIDEHECGWRVAPNLEAVSALIADITLEDVEAKRTAVRRFPEDLGWHTEEQRLLEVYP
jgi:glycosyltransferase involved in cell wall biosynthesis